MTSEKENLLTEEAPKLRTRPLKGYQNPQELENRRRGVAHLKEVYSSIPWYKKQGEEDGDQFWENLYSKAPLRKY